jgi:outer membrane lipoprotein-sorting protein
MKNILILLITIFWNGLFAQNPDANEMLRKIDENMYSGSIKSVSKMTIHGRRSSRTVSSINYSQGSERSFSEYTSPPREKGTKMLKLDDNLWIYDPSTDRTVQISGNMLKQAVMGSDLSYEDFMAEEKISESYQAEISGETVYLERDCWILDLTALSENAAYHQKKYYVDKERFLPLYEEWYSKNNRLLKSVKVKEVMQSGKRWYPKKAVFKDELKEGKGTEFIIDSIEFDVKIPEYIFSRAALRK